MFNAAFLILCMGICAYCLLNGTAKLLKALEIKVKEKPAPMTEAEQKALEAHARQEEKMAEAMEKVFGLGGGGFDV